MDAGVEAESALDVLFLFLFLLFFGDEVALDLAGEDGASGLEASTRMSPSVDTDATDIEDTEADDGANDTALELSPVTPAVEGMDPTLDALTDPDAPLGCTLALLPRPAATLRTTLGPNITLPDGTLELNATASAPASSDLLSLLACAPCCTLRLRLLLSPTPPPPFTPTPTSLTSEPTLPFK